MIATIFQKIFRRDINPDSVSRINKVLGKINFRTCTYMGGLILLTILAFGISVDSFFVADDMWQVNFADKVFHGRSELIWRNFTSNYLQIPSLDFYRPLLGFTFLLDYMLYGTWSPGYHITSIVLYLVSVVLLFIVLRRMTRSWPEKNSQSVAYLGAALFAVSPLHCEDVCWISGRADLLCAPFYLLAFYCVIRSHQDGGRRLYFLGLLLFILAMFSKEIGIGLPIVVAAYYFFWPEEDKFAMPIDMPQYGATRYQRERVSRHKLHMERILKQSRNKKKKKKKTISEDQADKESVGDIEIELEEDPDQITSFRGRLKFSFLMSYPFFIAALVYLAIRYMALGTVIGGYSGMIGGALSQHLVLRWFDLSYFGRILIPIPEVVAAQSEKPFWTIVIALVCSLFIVALRIYSRSDPRKWILFLSVWMISCALPLLKLWGVGHELQTSRLLFFFTMGYSALLPILMFHPTSLEANFKLPKKADAASGIVSATILSAIVVALAWVSFSTSLLWVMGGAELKSVWLQTVELARGLGEGEKVLVLNVPKDFHGAHVSFNGSTFHEMLRPPFVKEDLSSRVVTFEPYIVGPAEVINATRFKMYLSLKKMLGPYAWSRETAKLEKVNFEGDYRKEPELDLPISEGPDKGSLSWQFVGKGSAKVKEGVMSIDNIEDGDALKLSGLNELPFSYNFLEVKMRVRQNKEDVRGLVPMALSWNHSSVDRTRPDWVVIAVKPDKLKNFQTLRMQPSHFFRWYTQGAIKSLILRLPEKVSIDIASIRLVRGQDLMPFLFLTEHKMMNNGEFVIDEREELLKLVYDASMVDPSARVEAELSKPNFFFDSYLMSDKETPVLNRIVLNKSKGTIELSSKLFSKPAYYQIRIRALDKDNNPIGVWSDTITILRLGGGLDTYIH